MKYRQLTPGERYQIQAYKQAGLSIREMSRYLGRAPSTVSRELQRNTDTDYYDAQVAQCWALGRRHLGGRAAQLSESMKRQVESLMRWLRWSPEQVSGWCQLLDLPMVSHTRLYQHIHADRAQGGDLYQSCRRRGKRCRKLVTGRDTRGRFNEAPSIEQRPAIVDEKARLGDWEIDSIVGAGRSGYLMTVVERKSLLMLMTHVASHHEAVVTEAIINLMKPWSSHIQSITADRGKEFSGYEKISKVLKADWYFAHPYSSWERGLSEQTNGLVRDYWPKKARFDTITPEQVAGVMEQLNHRPRKTLGFKTPIEVFRELSASAH